MSSTHTQQQPPRNNVANDSKINDFDFDFAMCHCYSYSCC